MILQLEILAGIAKGLRRTADAMVFDEEDGGGAEADAVHAAREEPCTGMLHAAFFDAIMQVAELWSADAEVGQVGSSSTFPHFLMPALTHPPAYALPMLSTRTAHVSHVRILTVSAIHAHAHRKRHRPSLPSASSTAPLLSRPARFCTSSTDSSMPSWPLGMSETEPALVEGVGSTPFVTFGGGMRSSHMFSTSLCTSVSTFVLGRD